MEPSSSSCVFCGIAGGHVPAHVVYETDRILAFLDINPIRPGHTQIIPRQHFACFDELPGDLLSEIAATGQLVARAHKEIYGVKRVGFAFTGTDIAHAHAHVVPMVASDDITSRRFIAEATVTYRNPSPPSPDEFIATTQRMRDGLSRY